MESEEYDIEEKEQDYFEWMWCDAGTSLPGWSFLASVNPLRWSSGDAISITRELSQYCDSKRQVKLRVIGENYCHTFSSPSATIDWITNCNTKSSPGSSIDNIASTIALWTAAPALALFCRSNSQQAWGNRHLFKASSYAYRVTNHPLSISKQQSNHGEKPSTNSIQRQEVPWSHFDDTRELSSFIEIAFLRAEERPTTVSRRGQNWTLWDYPSQCNYHVVYTTQTEAIVAFRGGDGSLEDAKNHLGSPARPFMHGLDESHVPKELPSDIIEQLGAQGYSVTIVGYSQGGIPALACSLQFAKHNWFQGCTLLNNATMFWPAWLDKFLPPGNWWIDGFKQFPEWQKLDNWVIKNDPISEGMPGGSIRAPLAPGITHILPSKSSGTNLMENHSLVHFLPVQIMN